MFRMTSPVNPFTSVALHHTRSLRRLHDITYKPTAAVSIATHRTRGNRPSRLGMRLDVRHVARLRDLRAPRLVMQSESDMPKAFEDYIRDVGAPTVLISDNSKVQLGKSVRNLLRMYCIGA